MKLNELKNLIDNELEITDDNILEKTRTTSKLYSRVLQLYFAELKKLNGLKMQIDRIYARCYLDIKRNGYEGVEVGKTKSEIEIFINMDNEYSQLLSQIKDAEIIVKYLEASLDNINKISFHVKNYIELKRLQAGIV